MSCGRNKGWTFHEARTFNLSRDIISDYNNGKSSLSECLKGNLPFLFMEAFLFKKAYKLNERWVPESMDEWERRTGTILDPRSKEFLSCARDMVHIYAIYPDLYP